MLFEGTVGALFCVGIFAVSAFGVGADTIGIDASGETLEETVFFPREKFFEVGFVNERNHSLRSAHHTSLAHPL